MGAKPTTKCLILQALGETLWLSDNHTLVKYDRRSSALRSQIGYSNSGPYGILMPCRLKLPASISSLAGFAWFAFNSAMFLPLLPCVFLSLRCIQHSIFGNAFRMSLHDYPYRQALVLFVLEKRVSQHRVPCLACYMSLRLGLCFCRSRPNNIWSCIISIMLSIKHCNPHCICKGKNREEKCSSDMLPPTFLMCKSDIPMSVLKYPNQQAP